MRQTENLLERLTGLMGQKLPVAPGVVGGGTHRRKISLPFLRMNRRAGELLVRQLNPEPFRYPA